MIQAPAYCSYYYHVGYFQIRSMHLLGIWRDLFILSSPKLWFMLVMPSVVKGGGVVRECINSYADTWADIATCHSTPLGSTSW